MFNPQVHYKWHSKTAVWCLPKTCPYAAQCICVGYLKCLLGSHAMQQHIAKTTYTEILKNWAHGNSSEEDIILKTCHLDKMQRNNYTSEISKQVFWVGHFSFVNLDFPVSDLAKLTVKQIIINLKGDFKISHTKLRNACCDSKTDIWTNKTQQLALLRTCRSHTEQVQMGGSKATDNMSSSPQRATNSLYEQDNHVCAVTWCCSVPGCFLLIWGSAPGFLGMGLAHVMVAPKPCSWPQPLSCFAAGSGSGAVLKWEVWLITGLQTALLAWKNPYH